tara:strand:- start:1943 stop:2179 length:237 start_codon:yes stop_codon:yes gene_type:complete
MAKKKDEKVVKLTDFVTQDSNPKSPLQQLVRHVTRETNRHKFTYDQLRYVFKSVRANCDISLPRRRQRLIDLPTDEEE